MHFYNSTCSRPLSFLRPSPPRLLPASSAVSQGGSVARGKTYASFHCTNPNAAWRNNCSSGRGFAGALSLTGSRQPRHTPSQSSPLLCLLSRLRFPSCPFIKPLDPSFSKQGPVPLHPAPHNPPSRYMSSTQNKKCVFFSFSILFFFFFYTSLPYSLTPPLRPPVHVVAVAVRSSYLERALH